MYTTGFLPPTCLKMLFRSYQSHNYIANPYGFNALFIHVQLILVSHFFEVISAIKLKTPCLPLGWVFLFVRRGCLSIIWWLCWAHVDCVGYSLFNIYIWERFSFIFMLWWLAWVDGVLASKTMHIVLGQPQH